MENNTQKSETPVKNSRYQRAGGLWKKETKDGRGYLSGRFTIKDQFGVDKDYYISVWPNRNKVEGDTKFDYHIDYDTEATKNAKPRPPFVKKTAPVVPAEEPAPVAAASDDKLP